jgi:hypothetical protein
MAAERHLRLRAEVADVRLAVGAGDDERRLGVADLGRDRQHRVGVEAAGVEDDPRGIASAVVHGERGVAQHRAWRGHVKAHGGIMVNDVGRERETFAR